MATPIRAFSVKRGKLRRSGMKSWRGGGSWDLGPGTSATVEASPRSLRAGVVHLTIITSKGEAIVAKGLEGDETYARSLAAEINAAAAT